MIPERTGWDVQNLAELTELVDYGLTASAKELDAGPKFLRITDIQGGLVSWSTVPSCNCTVEEQKKHQLQSGDIVFARTGATTGKSYLIEDFPEGAVFASYLIRVRPNYRVLPQYLAYFFATSDYWNQISQSSSGSAQPGVNATKLRNLKVPVSPLPEQERIVAILDEAFAAIDTATANTEKNLANARELFESELNAVFTQKGDGWVEKPLSSTCVVERGSSPRPIKTYLTDDPNGVNWVKIGDTKGVVKYIHTTKQKITKEGSKRSRRVNPGDFILTNSMSYGKPYIMATSGYIHDGWFVLRLPENINSNFFYYLLSSRIVQNQFQTLAAGAIVKNISSALVKRAILPIPPLAEQERLADSIEMLAEETSLLESLYQRKIDALAELKQSILHKAFSGEMTAGPKPTDRTLSEAGL